MKLLTIYTLIGPIGLLMLTALAVVDRPLTGRTHRR